MSHLVDLASTLVAISSPSREEAELASMVERHLRGSSHLEVTRVGDNVIARTTLSRARRVVVAGHLDTVSTGSASPRIVDGELWGLGAADMKGTLAVMVDLADTLVEPTVDVSWVFYAREEITRSESGLLEIGRVAPALLEGDVALLGEPTGGAVEAGCQGTLRTKVTIGGITAHPARPFMGVNAVHRSAAVIDAVAHSHPRVVEIDGVSYAEQIQVVGISGGTAGNVVPGEASVLINHRFAPDRGAQDAAAWVESVLAPVLDETLGDRVELVDAADGARPHLTDPVLERLVALSGRPVVAKVGWTDVATFAERGIPAANFGAGDPLLAHHPDERVGVTELEHVRAVLWQLLSEPSAF